MTKIIAVENFKKLPGMSHWFSPRVLLDAARRAIISKIFANYSDGRLINAALDTYPDSTLFARCIPKKTRKDDQVTEIKPNQKGEVWIDYVADLGDGFDSTYSVAYMLAKKFLSVTGYSEDLPRGQALIMGGDQVYPVATREDYTNRLHTPYRAAFPNSNHEDAEHPPLFLIPGNHDWYDGLTLFLALFCRGRETSLGSWRAIQHRSYFALSLPFDWWIWGFDSQLNEDIDKPQAEYFTAIARQMPENAKIIICASVPSWLKAEMSAKSPSKRQEYYRSLDYIANIAKNECIAAKIFAVLSGDLHHYSRYSSDDAGTQFITAGGGGAFLHPTHHLKDEIKLKWLKEQHSLFLKTEPEEDHKFSEQEACYPSRSKSRSLAWGNLLFPLKNLEFAATLGFLYAGLVGLLLLGNSDFGIDIALRKREILDSPLSYFVSVAVLGIFWKYAEGHNTWSKTVAGLLHGVTHLAAILSIACALPLLTNWLHSFIPDLTIIPNVQEFFIAFITIIICGGLIGGGIWGFYLFIVNFCFGLHANDAFSAMRLDKYRNFLRICLKENEMIIYPIGLEKSLHRKNWEVNSNAKSGNQIEATIIPKVPLNPKLIERAIIIRDRTVKKVEDVSKDN